MTSKDFTVNNRDRLVNELIEFLKLKSVSADPQFNDEVARTAEFVSESMKKAGINHVEICPTAGHPIVYGEHIIAVSYTHLTLPTIA